MNDAYKILEDGSILIGPKFPLTEGFLTKYSQDPENPYRFIPKFKPCVSRRFSIKTLSCGRPSVRWSCGLDDSTVSIESCSLCTKRAEA
jgi:hypothetical protein